MRQIVDGKAYDTETADLIGNVDCGHPYASDFSYWDGSMYKTKRSGRYFIAGSGGPMSMFSVSVGQNEWGGSDGIIVLEPDEALEICEDQLDAEVIEKFFDIEEA